jgi:hypothetical protein
MGMWTTLRTKKQATIKTAVICHSSSIRDILAMRNMVALKLISEYSKDMGLHIQSNAYESPWTHLLGLIQIYSFQKKIDVEK